MTIYPNLHNMEATVDVSLPDYAAHKLFETTSLQADSPPQSRWSDKFIDKNGMSVTFRDAFKNFMEHTKSTDLIKVSSRPQSKYERINDALSRTEHLLLSSDNVRPPSKQKSHKDNNDQIDREPIAGCHNYTSEETNETQLLENCEGTKFEREFGISAQENGNDTNNSSEKEANTANINIVLSKKGKKHKKRNKIENKSKRNKPGRLSVPATGIRHETNKRILASTFDKISSASSLKPRISSEPINSKPTQSYTLEISSSENATNKQLPFSANHRSASDVVYSNIDSRKASRNGEKTVPSTHYTHGSAQLNYHSHKNALETVQIEIQPLTAQKVELNKRIKSGHSIKSEVGYNYVSSQPESQSSPVVKANQYTIATKTCNLPQMNTENISVVMQSSTVKQKTAFSSNDSVSKENSLAAIYGPLNNIPHRAFSNAEDFRKVKKIFLSEKQSGTLKKNGMEFPCAPPATPVPDVMKRYEYIPCMNDIRSQRAVRTKLQVMEREAQRKKEKQKEATVKLEKQQQKDREKVLKTKQRREIYALNKTMTELEHKRYLEFCHSKGLNT